MQGASTMPPLYSFAPGPVTRAASAKMFVRSPIRIEIIFLPASGSAAFSSLGAGLPNTLQSSAPTTRM